MILFALVACGAKPPPPGPSAPEPAISVLQWKVEAAEGERVNVTLVVDGTAFALGSLASTAYDAVGPTTCAVRSAPTRSELVCGDANYYAADIVGQQLVITHVDGEAKSEVRRVPIAGDTLAVKALVL